MTIDKSEANRGKPQWDEELAQDLAGSLVLVGLTRLNSASEEIERTQFYGRITSADQTRGIALRLEGKRDGETCTLPPETQAFHRTKPGRYTLKSTGEVVVDPDFTTTWTIQEPSN